MVFSSLTFLMIFFPAVILFYFIVPSRFRNIRNYVLLAVSIIFYSWGEPIYVFIILLTILITYLFSKEIAQKNVLALAIVIMVNLLPLIVFKYTDFIIMNINLLPGIEMKMPGISLPIGISFYTFQVLSYVIDLYRGRVKIQKNPMYIALYVFLFPQLIAGPIVRYETIEYEIENRKENWSDFQAGLVRFVMGLSKKVLISNQAGFIVKTIVEQEQTQIGGGLLWLMAFSYAIQIYFDFSGYSDMAIGLGRMFGFHFLENFNYPYAATSITDFWRRWHISLSTFFRDYIYIPLGGNRVTTFRWFINMAIVWFLTGMWHGPFWNYIMWGIYYCVLLIIEKYLLQNILKRIPTLISWTYTFVLTMIGWVIFMTETNNPGDLALILKKMLLFRSYKSELSIRSLQLQPNIPYIIIGLVLAFPILAKLKGMKIAKTKGALILCSIGIVILYMMSYTYIISESFNPFIYFRF